MLKSNKLFHTFHRVRYISFKYAIFSPLDSTLIHIVC